MTKNQIVGIIRDHIESECDLSLEEEELSVESDLWKLGLVDSFKVLSVVAFLEQKFSVRFFPRDMQEMEEASVMSFTNMVLEKGAQ